MMTGQANDCSGLIAAEFFNNSVLLSVMPGSSKLLPCGRYGDGCDCVRPSGREDGMESCFGGAKAKGMDKL